MATTDARLTEHPLLREHIEGGMALSKAANWNQNEADWQLFFDLGIGMGCSDQNGRLCATTMIIPLGARFAWISVVLVADDMRRRGLASQLTKWAVGELNRMGVVPYLDATPAGREVYLRLGFQDCWWLERLIAPTLHVASAALSTVIVRPIDDAIWPRVFEYDAAIFGADRRAILAPFRNRMPKAALYAMEAGQVVGFVLARDGRLNTQIGPICADRPEIAIALLTQVLAQVAFPVCIDLPVRHQVIRDWLCANGFTVGRPFARMALGRADTFDDSARLIASAGPEFG